MGWCWGCWGDGCAWGVVGWGGGVVLGEEALMALYVIGAISGFAMV